MYVSEERQADEYVSEERDRKMCMSLKRESLKRDRQVLVSREESI